MDIDQLDNRSSNNEETETEPENDGERDQSSNDDDDLANAVSHFMQNDHQFDDEDHPL